MLLAQLLRPAGLIEDLRHRQADLGVALQLLSTMVLSRVLTPAEVGTFAVATVFAALASNFRDFGVAEYLKGLVLEAE